MVMISRQRQSHYRHIQVHDGAQYAHLCAHNHTTGSRFSATPPKQPERLSGSPLVSHSEGVSGCQDFLSSFQNQCQTLSFPHRVSHWHWHQQLSFYHYHKWYPPLCLPPATVRDPFTTLSLLSRDSVVSPSTGAWREVKRSRTRAARGRKEMWNSVKERTKGLYRKSITLFHFSDIWLGRDKAKASFPKEQYMQQ